MVDVPDEVDAHLSAHSKKLQRGLEKLVSTSARLERLEADLDDISGQRYPSDVRLPNHDIALIELHDTCNIQEFKVALEPGQTWVQAIDKVYFEFIRFSKKAYHASVAARKDRLFRATREKAWLDNVMATREELTKAKTNKASMMLDDSREAVATLSNESWRALAQATYFNTIDTMKAIFVRREEQQAAKAAKV